MLLMSISDPGNAGPPPDQFIPISATQDPARASRRRNRGCWIVALVVFIALCVIGGVIAGVALGRFWFDASPVIATPLASPVEPTSAVVLPSATLTPGLIPTQANAPTLTPFPTNTLPPTQPASPTLPPTASPVSTTTPGAQPTWLPCAGTYYSRLHVGDIAYISFDPPLPNRLRREPNTASEILAMLQPGERIEIIGGPVCSNQWIWWQVRSRATGITGWTAEGDAGSYWLVPGP